MKKLMIFGISFLFALGLTGCVTDDSGEPVLPDIEIVGEDIITIEVGETFDDPGAVIVGDFELEIHVDSDLNINEVGEYEITYSIIYEDIVYRAFRTVKVVLQDTPILQLNGEDYIVISLMDEYVEEGAIISNEFDLPITISGFVDVYNEGVYEITYSVTYMGTTYSISRSVEVVYTKSIDEILNISITYDQISFDQIAITIDIDNDEELLSNGYVVLSDGTTEIAREVLLNGEHTYHFISLSENTLYTIDVIGTYQLNEEIVPLQGYKYLVSTVEEPVIDFQLNGDVVDRETYNATINTIDTNQQVSSAVASIYFNDEIVKSFTIYSGINYTSFTGLLEGTQYELRIDYTYTSIDTSLEVTKQKSIKTFTTLESSKPEITSETCNLTATSIECTFDISTNDLSNISLIGELREGNTFISNDFVLNNAITFTNLTENTTYTLNIYADYYNETLDETYYSVLIKTISLTTEELTTNTLPTVENITITPIVTENSNSIQIDFDLIDPDNAVSNAYVRLYRGTSQSAKAVTVGHNSITYTGYPVYENELYTVKITVTYYVDDVEIEWDYVIYEEDLIVPPYIEVISFEPEGTYFENDHLIMIIDLDNDIEVEIKNVSINGELFTTFLWPSDTSKLYIDLGEQLVGGDVLLHLEHITVEAVSNTLYTVDTDITKTVTIHQPNTYVPDTATINVLDLYVDDYTTLVSDLHTDYVELKVALDNPYHLEVNDITINGTTYHSSSFIENSTELLSINIEVTSGFNNFYLQNLGFTRNNEQFDSNVDEVSKLTVYGYEIEDVVYISTPEQLQAMSGTNGKIYILNNDIDLTGIDFEPIGTVDNPFGNAFDGNGYTISNLSIHKVETEQTQTDGIGLFGYASAFIYNLTIEDTSINVTTNGSHVLHIGTLAGHLYGRVIDVTINNTTIHVANINGGSIGGLAGYATAAMKNVTADATITVDGYDDSVTTSYAVYVGGLVGYSGYEDIVVASSEGMITVSNNDTITYYVGGLIGYLDNTSSAYADLNFLKHAYSTVDVVNETTYYGATGGLVGYSGYVYRTSKIINSYSSGSVFSNAGDVGGLIGYGNAYIEGSFAIGRVESIHSTPGRLVGDGNGYNVSNSVRYIDQLAFNNGNPTVGADNYGYDHVLFAGNEQLNDIEFYLNHLNWNEYFYSFNSLDTQNEVLPVHN